MTARFYFPFCKQEDGEFKFRYEWAPETRSVKECVGEIITNLPVQRSDEWCEEIEQKIADGDLKFFELKVAYCFGFFAEVVLAETLLGANLYTCPERGLTDDFGGLLPTLKASVKRKGLWELESILKKTFQEVK